MARARLNQARAASKDSQLCLGRASAVFRIAPPLLRPGIIRRLDLEGGELALQLLYGRVLHSTGNPPQPPPAGSPLWPSSRLAGHFGAYGKQHWHLLSPFGRLASKLPIMPEF